MSVILGVDVGGSTTKIVALNEKGEICGFLQVRAGDQLTSLFGAVGNLLYSFGAFFAGCAKIVLTGRGRGPGRSGFVRNSHAESG